MRRNRALWLAAMGCLILDRLTKVAAIRWVQPLGTVPLWRDVWHLTYVTNTGAAFSLLPGAVDWLRWVSLVVCVVLVGVGWRAKDLNRWEQWGYGCLLGGAAGNGIDRFVWGYVVDFVDVRAIRFPVFNVADVAIDVGLVCLIVAYVRGKR
ncbi:MAG: signal peptidase II [Pseudanabaenaceae cyanobacterium]